MANDPQDPRVLSPEAGAEMPTEGQIVLIRGGVAQYRNGQFYSGMEDPRWQRPITWPVKWWWPVNVDPHNRAKELDAEVARLNQRIQELEADKARLDWLDSDDCMQFWQDDHGGWLAEALSGLSGNSCDPREAIDQARAGEKPCRDRRGGDNNNDTTTHSE